MKKLRRLHLYLGIFFAPLLLFYVLTGWYQTLNPDRLKSPADAETLLQKLRTVHVDQVYPAEHEVKTPSSPKLFQGLVGAMAVAFVIMATTGVILGFKTLRPRWPVWASLALGFVVPVLVLWLGHRR